LTTRDNGQLFCFLFGGTMFFDMKRQYFLIWRDSIFWYEGRYFWYDWAIGFDTKGQHFFTGTI
jgi:hypothetical protein